MGKAKSTTGQARDHPTSESSKSRSPKKRKASAIDTPIAASPGPSSPPSSPLSAAPVTSPASTPRPRTVKSGPNAKRRLPSTQRSTPESVPLVNGNTARRHRQREVRASSSASTVTDDEPPKPSRLSAALTSSSTLVDVDFALSPSKAPLKGKAKYSPDELDDYEPADLTSMLKAALAHKVTSKGNEGVRMSAEPVRVVARKAKTEKPPWRPTDMSDVSIGDVVLVRSGTRGEWCLGVLYDWVIAQSEEEYLQKGDRFTVLRQMADMRKSSKVVKSGKDVRLKTDPRILECNIELFTIKRPSHEIENDARTRETTPPLDVDLNITNPNKAAIAKLDLASQLRLIRPTLSQIINDTYSPAMWRIDAFYSGKLAAAAKSFNPDLAQFITPGDLGDVTEREVGGIVIPELRRWALGLWPNSATSTGQSNDRSRPRPIGSARYEALSPAERERFIKEVLVKEAIIQICIASTDLSQTDPKNPEGKATSAEPTAEPIPTPDELYASARNHLSDLHLRSDWHRLLEQFKSAWKVHWWAQRHTADELGRIWQEEAQRNRKEVELEGIMASKFVAAAPGKKIASDEYDDIVDARRNNVAYLVMEAKKEENRDRIFQPDRSMRRRK